MTTLDDDLFLPEPEPAEVRATIISVDDHLVEPPGMFEGRLPARLQDRAPKVIVTDKGHEVWDFDGQQHFQVGMNAVAGRRPETVKVEPFRFDQMRRGCWDVDARVHDMDLGGIWASLSFPSMITGFCGRVYSQCSDPELGLAVTRAWNDWMHDEWWQPHPDRIIPMGITFLTDPEAGAAEIRRNAERGFRTVTLPERPHAIGLPSIFDRPLGADPAGLRGDRHRGEPARRVVGGRGDPAGLHRCHRAVDRHAVRPAVRSPPASSGCGRAGRCGCRT
jgi:hypothetical protein